MARVAFEIRESPILAAFNIGDRHDRVLAEFPLRRRFSIIFSLNGTAIDLPS